MIISISEQVSLFFIMFITGFLISFIFDVFRILRREIKHNIVIIYIEDVLYFIFVGFIVFYILLSNNYGEIRFFIFIGIFIGGILYFLILSRFICCVILKCIYIIKKIIITIFNIILIPTRFIIYTLYYPTRFIIHKILRVYKIKVKKLLKEIYIILKKV